MKAVGRLERCLVVNHGYQAHAVRGVGPGREGVLAHVRLFDASHYGHYRRKYRVVAGGHLHKHLLYQ